YEKGAARAAEEADGDRLADAVRTLDDENERLRGTIEDRLGSGSVGARIELPRRLPGGRHGDDIDWVERIALSFGLSIALVSLIGLLLNATVGIRLESIVVSILLFTVVIGLVAYDRQIGLPPEDRLTFRVSLRPSAWEASSALDKVLAVALAASIVFAAATVVYLATAPRPAEHFTQLYLLNGNRTAGDYPTDLNVSEPGVVTIVITNNESTRVDYTVRVDRLGVIISRNPLTGKNETIVVNETTLDSFNVSLDDRATWEQTYLFQIDSPGSWKMNFLLFRDHNFANAYRNVYFFVNVPR
ncbi:MAG: DUF1616 domain-containing protein, partial [Thermoplasmata archaeon]